MADHYNVRRMKKLFLFVLLLAAGFACMRPEAFVRRGAKVEAGISTEEGVDASSNMKVEYTVDLRSPATRTLLLGDAALFDEEVAGDGRWLVQLTAADGCLEADDSARPTLRGKSGSVDLQLSMCWLPTTLLHMPDGSVQPQQHLLLCAEMDYTPLWRWLPRRHAELRQELVIDTRDAAVDMVIPSLPTDYKGAWKVRMGSDAARAVLPARFCGSATEQALQRFLFRMAAMYDTASAEAGIAATRRKARELIEQHADTALPWPQCWGQGASAALGVHKRILPYLQRAQAENCFDCAELADFINSEDFARIFGDSWGEKAPEQTQEPQDEEEEPLETEFGDDVLAP